MKRLASLTGLTTLNRTQQKSIFGGWDDGDAPKETSSGGGGGGSVCSVSSCTENYECDKGQYPCSICSPVPGGGGNHCT